MQIVAYREKETHGKWRYENLKSKEVLAKRAGVKIWCDLWLFLCSVSLIFFFADILST